jgi:pyridoxine/pyridoxamine 5'-phosphate oxidase
MNSLPESCTPAQRVEMLLTQAEHAVLATASTDGKPEAATVQFVADEHWRIYFNTFSTYRKYRNLAQNPRASIVVTVVPYTVQLDGVVRELSGGDAERAREAQDKKRGRPSSFAQDPHTRYFCFVPTWIRVLVQPEYPPQYEEVKPPVIK